MNCMQSENTSNADNQQGSPLVNISYDPSETTRRIPHINNHFAILLGILFTDRCVSPKGSSWRIYLAVTSKELVTVFKESIIRVFNIPEHRVLMGLTKDGLEKAVVNSKEIGDYLFARFGTFRTLDFRDGTKTKARLPISELLSSGHASDFLRVAFSCDGGISLYVAHRNGVRKKTLWLIRTVFLACSHKKLRSDYLTLLKFFHIHAREVPRDGKIKIETEGDIRRFYEKLGFLEDVEITRHSKFWLGYTKQQVLRLTINSYRNPASIYSRKKFAKKVMI